ncbi:MAG TPA: family 1 encapsulin nanocompartment shell protein [Planctomycetota bacterium]|nr:family 1 encapsulin nanocompartment shell protein [Planctomycetota bacterium]
MNLLKRDLAPILPEAWAAIDAEATRVLKLNLAGRRLFDFDGPHGWKHAAVNTGRLVLCEEQPVEGVKAGLRHVQRLVEVRTPFVLDIMALDEIARGRADADLDPVIDAAMRTALFEERAIFHGWKVADIDGVLPASPHEPIKVAAARDYPEALLAAQETLRKAGVEGPYALALGPAVHEELMAATEEGYPLLRQIGRPLIDGPLVRSPALDGAVVVSVRGGDYEISVGQDLSIGYAAHDRDRVELYITETFTFRVLTPTAAVRLVRA